MIQNYYRKLYERIESEDNENRVLDQNICF